MTQEQYSVLQAKINEISEEMQDWGSFAQICGFLATHEKVLEETGLVVNGLFKGYNPLYWIDRYISGHYADSPEAIMLSMQGYEEEMENTKEFGVHFLNFLHEFGGKVFTEYQNALIFNSEYLDNL